MKVFVVGKRNANSFFDEIEKHSKTLFTYGQPADFDPSYDALLIHWPESIFDWEEVTTVKLENVTKFLETIQKTIPIYHCVHNLQAHGTPTKNDLLLYNLIWSFTDVFIHLGNYSKELLEKKFPEKEHVFINHPLYESTIKKYEKDEARVALNIPLDAQVFFIPGKIRNLEERKLLIKGFKKIRSGRKILISHRFYFKPFPIRFPKRPRIKRLLTIFHTMFDAIYNRPLSTKEGILKNEFLDIDKLGKLMSASDVIVIPRLKSLNSGMLYLALAYKKPVVAPLIGNITEVVSKTNNFGFDPRNKNSFYENLISAIHSKRQYTDDELIEFSPKACARFWDNLFSNKKQR